MTKVRPARLFHYQSFVEQYVTALLVERRVKLSRADGFNDPWDCRLRYIDPQTDADRDRILAWFAAMHRKRFPEISEMQRTDLVSTFKSDPMKLLAALRKTESQMYAEICRLYRIYCLTEEPASPLMWSHYAKAHTGICLEFDATSLPFGAATRVEYRNAYPQYDLVSVGVEPLIAKSADWSYEAEWRLIAEERSTAQSTDTIKTDSDFLLLPTGCLKSVTVGCLADSGTRDRVSALVSSVDPSAIIRQAEIASDSYGLVITPPFD